MKQNEKGFTWLEDLTWSEELMSAIPEGIVFTADDECFTLLFANQGYYDMVGYSTQEHQAEFHGIGLATIHPDEAQAAASQAREGLAREGRFRLKARLCHKTRGYLWAHFHGRLLHTPQGEGRVCIAIADVSEQMETLEQLRKEQYLTDLLSSLFEESFFDCDLVSGTVRCSKHLSQELGVAEVSSDCLDTLARLGLVDSTAGEVDEIALWEALSHGAEREIHLVRPDGTELWYLCRCHVVRGTQGLAVRIVGGLRDITGHKRQIDQLSHLAQLDQLTGLYNKATTEQRIAENLHMRRLHDDSSALLIIDVDNFKSVNDRLGHLYGDVVLTQLAEHLKGMFRAEDVVGRVGGDEFFVFMKSYRSLRTLENKAREICRLFHKTYSQGENFVTISASIGIAQCPEHGTDFDTLYSKADTALYESKARGKNTFSLYRPDLSTEHTAKRTKIDASTLQKSFKHNRLEYVFRLLYDSEDPVASIQGVLRLLTESYDFSRGYIFETSDDGSTTSNTFEWCVQEVTPEIEHLQQLPIESVATAQRAFLKTGMFILRSISTLPEVERQVLEPQGIRSMFQFGVMDRGNVVGFIGFDDCKYERAPTESEADEICTVCHVLATFLLKHRSNQRELRHHETLERVLGGLRRCLCVVDPQRHTVLYENDQMVRRVGRPSVGRACHVAYGGRALPCADCATEKMAGRSVGSYMPTMCTALGRNVGAVATVIRWLEDRPAILLCGEIMEEPAGAKEETDP